MLFFYMVCISFKGKLIPGSFERFVPEKPAPLAKQLPQAGQKIPRVEDQTQKEKPIENHNQNLSPYQNLSPNQTNLRNLSEEFLTRASSVRASVTCLDSQSGWSWAEGTSCAGGWFSWRGSLLKYSEFSTVGVTLGQFSQSIWRILHL